MEFEIVHIRSLFENATEGMVVTDSKGVIILVNPSACRMFGYEAPELKGQRIEILVPSRYAGRHVALRDGFYHDPKNRIMGHNRDLNGQKKNGDNFPVEVSLSTYVQNAERYVIAFIIDITQRKLHEQNILSQKSELESVSADMRKMNTDLEVKVEQRTIILSEALQKLEESQSELNEALSKEKELNEIKSRFVSMASHEFRTPLSTILSSASLVEKYTSTEDQENRSRHVEKIRNSVRHLNTLLEDFLSLGKLEEGKIGTHFQEFNVKGFILDTIDEMKEALPGSRQFMYNHIGQAAVFSDKNLLKNILFNLISNALKFSDDVTPVEIISEVVNDTLVITVRDEGIGISEEDQEHLFSSFFRGKNVVNIQGTGLGLHIVRRYAELLQGSVSLKSKLGVGTSVTVSIPLHT